MARADVSVIIVGAGIAGACAALELARAGIGFVGIDAAAGFGGTAARGAAGICVPGSPLQRIVGIVDDNADLALADLIRDNPQADAAWGERYFRAAATDVYGFLAELGIVFGAPRPMEGDSRRRWHGPEGLGRAVMDRLWQAGLPLGFAQSWHFRLRLTGLLIEDGHVRGVYATGEDGATQVLRAPRVLVATGGFAGNRALALEWAPQFATGRFLASGGPGARGEGHCILLRHGATLSHSQNLYAYATAVPDPRDPEGQRAVIALGIADWVWLNAHGERFHDETLTGRAASRAMLDQPGATAWAIFDSAMAPDLLVNDHYQPPDTETRTETAVRYLATSADVRRAATLESLIAACGLPSAAANTVTDWNALLASGQETDPLTERSLAGLRPLTQPPYLAIPIGLAARKCLGGILTDADCRVLDAAGQAMPGLWAAGELTGMAGGHLLGNAPLEGMMFGGSLFSGRVAGRALAQEAGTWEDGRPWNRAAVGIETTGGTPL